MQDYEKLFSFLNNPKLPENLLDKIMQRIAEEKKLNVLRKKLMIFSLGTAFSAAALVFAFFMLKTDLAQSDFLSFFSLIFSDFGVLRMYWQNFAMSLMESLPVLSLSFVLFTVLLLLESLKLLINNINNFFKEKQILAKI